MSTGRPTTGSWGVVEGDISGLVSIGREKSSFDEFRMISRRGRLLNL